MTVSTPRATLKRSAGAALAIPDGPTKTVNPVSSGRPWLLPKNHPRAKDAASDFVVVAKPGQPEELTLAQAKIDPTVQAAATIQRFQGDGNVNAFAEELAAQVRSVHAGDLTHAEALLITQASTLNELFNNLARTARNQSLLHPYETYLRIALRAQAQCCRTLEVLAGIKNPPVVFAKQANVTTGPQQVNNGVPAPAQLLDFQQNKLSGPGYELRTDTRAPAITGRANSTLATVGAIDGAGNAGRQGEGKPQRIQRRDSADATPDRARSARAGKMR